MMYRAPHSNRFSPGIRIGALGVLIIAFFLLHGPFLIRQSAVFVSRFFSGSRLQTSASDTTKALQATIADQESQIQTLQSQLANRSLFTTALVTAHVRFGGGWIFSDTIFIDRGSRDGISAGDPVISDSRILVGTIDQIGANWGSVAPFSKLGRKTVVRTGSHKEIVFELTGIGGGEMTTDLPASVALVSGDMIWWGEASQYQMGVIDHIDRSSATQVEHIVVRQVIPLTSLDSVFVELLHV